MHRGGGQFEILYLGLCLSYPLISTMAKSPIDILLMYNGWDYILCFPFCGGSNKGSPIEIKSVLSSQFSNPNNITTKAFKESILCYIHNNKMWFSHLPCSIANYICGLEMAEMIAMLGTHYRTLQKRGCWCKWLRQSFLTSYVNARANAYTS